jgi:hypothetical protein
VAAGAARPGQEVACVAQGKARGGAGVFGRRWTGVEEQLGSGALKAHGGGQEGGRTGGRTRECRSVAFCRRHACSTKDDKYADRGTAHRGGDTADGPAIRRDARPVGLARTGGRRVARREPQGVSGRGAAWGRRARPREARGGLGKARTTSGGVRGGRRGRAARARRAGVALWLATVST